jgi:hypothetical protein
MDNGKKSKAGKIFKGCLIGIGGLTTIGCIGYVVKEVKREYDETVNENNRLRAFINEHDFYEKQQTNFRSSNYTESSNDEEPEEKKFDKNNPVYKQSPATMRKLGLNPDGTRRPKTQLVKIGEFLNQDGYVVEVNEDVPTGLKIYSPTIRTVLSKDETKEEIAYGNN